MTINLMGFPRRFLTFRVLTGTLIAFSSFLANAQTFTNQKAAADSLLIAVNNTAIAGEYAFRGFTANFAFPVMSMISVTDDSGNVVTGLANTLRWLNRNENAEIGMPISQIWRPLLEYHRDNPAIPPDPNIYNQTSGPFFTEVRKSAIFPTSTMLVMDVSGSMQEALADAKVANRIYVDLLRGFDRTGVIQFDHSIVRFQKMTSNGALLRAVIDAAVPAGATAIYDALALAIQETKLEANRRRAIILYTDGIDNASSSTNTPQAVIDSALAYGIPIFTIALGDLTSEDVLKQIARATGGFFFKSVTAADMSSIYRRLSEVVQNFYLMAHGSTDPVRNDTWRIVDVSANHSNRLGRGRSQYFVRGLKPPLGPTDLAFNFTSLTDTSVIANGKLFNAVRPGEAYSYRMIVRNQGAATAENIRVRQFLPDSVQLLGSSRAPLFTDGDSLAWQLARVEPGGEDSIVVAVRLAAAIPNNLRELASSAGIFCSTDTSARNNTATDTVKVVTAPPPPLVTDIAVQQSAQTDSFAVVGSDTLRFAHAGEIYSYQITVRNLGNVAAQNVVITDFLPDSIRASDFQPTPNVITADSLQWRFNDLPALGQVTLRFTAALPSNMPVGTNLLVNRINSRASNEDPAQLANNAAIDTVYNFVAPPPPRRATDLALGLTSATDTSIVVDGKSARAVKPGEQYQYRLKVANRGPAQSGNVRVRQTLPDSVQFVESTLAPLFRNADSLVWQIAPLNAGREDSIAITVRLAQTVPFTIDKLISRANLFASNDTTPSNNSDIDTAYVIFSQQSPQRARLAVRQTAQTDSFAVSGNDTLRFARTGEIYSYALSVRNESDVIAYNVTLDDLLPDSIRAGNFQPSPAFISSDSVRWYLGNLTPGAQLSLRLEATVARFMPVGTNLLINKIVAHAENENPAQLEGNTAIDTVYNLVGPLQPGSATDLRLAVNSITDTSVVENGRQRNAVRLGEEFAYRIAVQNLGPAGASNVRVRQFLPDSVRFMHATLPPLSANADSLVWQIAQINAGRIDSMMVVVQLAANVPSSLAQLISRAEVLAINDTLPSNNLASDTTKVLFIPAPPLRSDIAVLQSVQTDSFVVVGNDTLRFARTGETYSYQITVQNLSAVAAQNVVLTDFTPDSIRSGNFQPVPNVAGGDSVQWQLGTLSGLSRVTLRFEATVANNMPSGTNSLINKASVRASNESNARLSNNVSLDTVYNFVKPVQPPSNAVDLTLAFASVADTNIVVDGRLAPAVRPGEAYAYHLQIRNNGPRPARSVRVTQFLPDSVHFVQSTLPPIFAHPDSLAWQIDLLNAGRADSIAVTVRLAAAVPPDLFSLISRAHLVAINDTTPANNTARDTAFVIFRQPPPGPKAVLAVAQTAQTDSFAVSGSDTLRYAKSSETYVYRLTVSNESTVLAQNVTLTDFMPDSIRAGSFQPAPAIASSDSVRWNLGNLTPRARLSLQFEATVARFMPLGTNLLINKIVARAVNEDPLHHRNVAIDTVLNLARPPQPQLPLIEARPPVVNVGDSVLVRVQAPVPVVQWDLWVYLADGRIDSNYADAFIAVTSLTPGAWFEVMPTFRNTRLFTAAKSEQLIFEVRTRDIFGFAGTASA
ncbi:MAG: VWA domain-containing protein, partial [bacterium]